VTLLPIPSLVTCLSFHNQTTPHDGFLQNLALEQSCQGEGYDGAGIDDVLPQQKVMAR